MSTRTCISAGASQPAWRAAEGATDHGRECARACVPHGCGRLAYRRAIGKTGKAVDSTQTRAPFGKAEPGLGAKDARQSTAAGAGFVGPAVEIVGDAAVVEQGAGDA